MTRKGIEMKGNALFTGRGNESMHDVMKRREQEFFTPMEILVMEHLRNAESTDDKFVLTNETGLHEQNAHELFTAIRHLEELKIIQRRNCEAVAYEWNRESHTLYEILG